jgi:hypothetical protein
MPRATWEALGSSSGPPFVDQVAEAGLMSPGDFAHEILGQLQVDSLLKFKSFFFLEGYGKPLSF